MPKIKVKNAKNDPDSDSNPAWLILTLPNLT